MLAASEAMTCIARPRGKAALDALTAAAILLPGIVCSTASAQSEEGVVIQSARYQDGEREIAGVRSSLHPIAVDSLRVRSDITLANGNAISLSYTQDTWSGATPITTAPVSANGNRPIKLGEAGQLITVGASPMINGQLLLDTRYRPVKLGGGTDTLVAAPEVVHTLSSASPEARQQLDAKLARRLDNGAITLSGGISVERDFKSRFFSVGRRLDLNQNLTTVSLGFSRTHSSTAATLDHDAAPYITKTAYLGHIENVRGQQVLRGQRDDWAGSAGITHVLDPSALLEANLAFTRSAGYLANPYKLTSVIFAAPPAEPGAAGDSLGVLHGNLQALLEQRPAVRKQWSASGKLIVHHAPLDGALHMSYGYFRDDWAIAAHRLEAEWFQPIGEGALLSSRLRYYTQSAARFYTDYLVSRQAYRTVTIDDAGVPIVTAFNPKLLPPHFSSDHRLSAFGSIAAGVGLSKRIGRQLSFEVGVDVAKHSGALRAGGGGVGRFADFNYWMANAALRVDFSGEGRPPQATLDGAASAAHPHDGPHADHAAFVVPAGLQLAHTTNGSGDFMFGYRHALTRDSGAMLRGSTPVEDLELSAKGCGQSPCTARPLNMNMRMQMLDLMFGLSERVSLMVMPQYMSMDMDSRLIAGAPASDTPVHFGRHESAGLGDTQVHALLRMVDDPQRRWVLGLGLSVPTGDTDLRHRRSHGQDPTTMAYGMQTGSGTWDLMPSVTFMEQRGRWTLGGQLVATFHPQARNPDGYAVGNWWQAGTWMAYRISPHLAASVRGSYRIDAALKGQREGQAAGSMAADFAQNYGRREGELGLGVTFDGALQAHQGSVLGVEVLLPTRSVVNGYQLARRSSLALSWSHHF